MRRIAFKNLCRRDGSAECNSYQRPYCEATDLRVNHFNWRSQEGGDLLVSASCGATLCVNASSEKPVQYFPVAKNASGGRMPCVASWYESAQVEACNDAGEIAGLRPDHMPGKPRTPTQRQMFDDNAPIRVTRADADSNGDRVALGITIAAPSAHHLSVSNQNCKPNCRPAQAEVTAVRLSSSGRYVAFGDCSGHVIVLETATKTILANLRPISDAAPVTSISWRTDEAGLAYCAKGSNVVRVWLREGGQHDIPVPDVVSVACVRNTGIFVVRTKTDAGYSLQLLRILPDGTCQRGPVEIDGAPHDGEHVDDMAITHDGLLLASYCASDRNVNLWRMR